MPPKITTAHILEGRLDPNVPPQDIIDGHTWWGETDSL